MTIESFLIMLMFFSTISSLVTQVIKQVIADTDNRCYNIIALVTALIVGCCGTFVMYILHNETITLNTAIYAVLMGFASALASMLGYDKVKQAIEQLRGE